jgi:acetyltransferase-like isoleucine patch superfamily enzyme
MRADPRRLCDKIRSFAREPLLEKQETVMNWIWLAISQLYYRRFFQCLGRKSKILAPLRLKNVHWISIGNNVLIHKFGWLQTVHELQEEPRLRIDDGVILGNFNHVTCANHVHIGEKVLTADRVFISDHGHAFDDVTRPIMDQGIVSRGPVHIGEGSWLGENAVVLSCKIGKHSVIGANSVVIHDVPDYAVAVGSPARVIRRF